MSNRQTELLTPTISVSELPDPLPEINRMPIFAGIGALVGAFLALIQFTIIQNPEPTAVYTTIWTLMAWPFALAGAGLVYDYWRTMRQVNELGQWTAKMVAYTLTVQSRHAVSDHTQAALDEGALAGLVDSIIVQRQGSPAESALTRPEKVADLVGKHKQVALATLLAWVNDPDHIWTTEQWAMLDAIGATLDSATHQPKMKSTRMLATDAPPADLADILKDNPTEVVKATLEWVTDVNTHWTAPEWKLVEQIADAASRPDYEPKIEVARTRRSRATS